MASASKPGTIARRHSFQILAAVSLFVSLCLGQGARTEPKTHILARTDWPQFGFSASGGRFNPSEKVLNPKNVCKLKRRFKYAGPAGLGAPIVGGGMIFSGGSDGNIYALNANTGSFVWKAIGSTPTLANGVVYTGTSPSFDVYALNSETGDIVWAYNLYLPSTGIVVAGGVDYVSTPSTADYDFFALNAANGSLDWTTFIWGTPSLSAPAICGYLICMGATSYDDYRLIGISEGSSQWEYPVGGAIVSSPAAPGAVVYAGSFDGSVYALGADNGTLIWKYATAGPITSSPAVAYGKVYIGSNDGNVYALDAITGVLLWEFGVGNLFAGSPAVANGVVYVASSDNNIYRMSALNARTGRLLWKHEFKSEVSDPVVVNGRLYFGSQDGSLYAFGLLRKR